MEFSLAGPFFPFGMEQPKFFSLDRKTGSSGKQKYGLKDFGKVLWKGNADRHIRWECPSFLHSGKSSSLQTDNKGRDKHTLGSLGLVVVSYPDYVPGVPNSGLFSRNLVQRSGTLLERMSHGTDTPPETVLFNHKTNVTGST